MPTRSIRRAAVGLWALGGFLAANGANAEWNASEDPARKEWCQASILRDASHAGAFPVQEKVEALPGRPFKKSGVPKALWAFFDKQWGREGGVSKDVLQGEFGHENVSRDTLEQRLERSFAAAANSPRWREEHGVYRSLFASRDRLEASLRRLREAEALYAPTIGLCEAFWRNPDERKVDRYSASAMALDHKLAPFRLSPRGEATDVLLAYQEQKLLTALSALTYSNGHFLEDGAAARRHAERPMLADLPDDLRDAVKAEKRKPSQAVQPLE